MLEPLEALPGSTLVGLLRPYLPTYLPTYLPSYPHRDFLQRFFSKPNGHVPLGSTTEMRTLDGSFATLPSVPSSGTRCIVTAVVNMAGSRVPVSNSRIVPRPGTLQHSLHVPALVVRQVS